MHRWLKWIVYGDILPVHTREDAVLDELDSDSVWFVEDGDEVQ